MWTALICWIVSMVAGGILLLFGVEHLIPNVAMGILCALMYFSVALFIAWGTVPGRLPVPR